MVQWRKFAPTLPKSVVCQTIRFVEKLNFLRIIGFFQKKVGPFVDKSQMRKPLTIDQQTILMKKLLALAIVFLTWNLVKANNISVTNVSLTGQNTSAGANSTSNFTMVQFSVSWENSHRVAYGPINWDAAWIFVKYRVAGGNWAHASLNNTGHTAPVGSSVVTGLQNQAAAFNATTNPGIGTFIYRSSGGIGTFTATNVQLRWNYGANGVADNSVVEVQVHAIEMVYIPQGAFNIGGAGGTSAFTSTTISTATATTAPAGTGILGGQAGGFPTGQTAPASASFPNGFAASYCMKYEISQQQYVDFLNSLTTAQATARYSASTAFRNGITVSSGVYSTSFPNVACPNLSLADLLAYLDWSGLRPMTEMEFEKICRGTVAAVTGEFAWGNTSRTQTTGLTNAGLANEVASNAGANCIFGTNNPTGGPGRVGMFAGAATTRAQAGASFYGVMEMSGNMAERVISLTGTDGRTFTGTHGDGTIGTAGEPVVTGWPSSTSSTASSVRGGGFVSGSTSLVVSDRQDFGDVSGRNVSYGGRGVRTAP